MGPFKTWSVICLREIVETIPDFHNTRKRFDALMRAVEEDRHGRVASVVSELTLFGRVKISSTVYWNLWTEGCYLRITHNDTKIITVSLTKKPMMQCA